MVMATEGGVVGGKKVPLFRM